ncbi:YkgJ family cysteine cluster protein [Gellertiella hungarica]|uniref:Fe-S-cluster containining protein n=1 Tax=Gellertiella hungarica TaxID=1572859 RepID=A0A7W6J9I1_9HYPH|nr:Fe-S-cluster containining protein [Gellertiella hungarica]
MNEQRFACTACGLCCHGMLPLSIEEAFKWAHVFPLAMSATPVKPGTRGYAMKEVAVTFSAGAKKPIQLIVTPVAFIPPTAPCPKLADDGLCSIHEEKPQRCRTMPFYAYKEEDSQRDMLVPRPGWKCATGEDAPVVYRDRKIVDRAEFQRERELLKGQAVALQRYVDTVARYDPGFSMRVQTAATAVVPGRVIVGFVSWLRQNKELDVVGFARRQHPVLKEWLEKTAGDAKAAQFASYYREAIGDLERYLG